jgi:hypothetical protein
MVGIPSWVESNWFSLIQTVGIMGSLWLTAAAAIREAKAREIENLLTIAQNHRELWSGVYLRHELDRIFQTDVDMETIPVTVAEKEFLNLVMVHFQMGWRIAKAGGITTLTELAADVRGFFALPLPRAVWEKTKEFRNPKFVSFVERALRSV